MLENVSFIIPVYNTELDKFIRCIDSIEQINNKNCELIVIDDGSFEDFSKEYSIFLKKYKNIKYYKNLNNGVSYSRNFGIDHSSKKYVMFVDSDDYLLYDELNNINVSLDYDIILFNHINICNDKEIKYSFDEGIILWDDLIVDHARKGSVSSPCSKLYKLSFLNKNHLRFKTNYVQGEDAYFNLECLSFKPTIFYYNHPIYLYDYSPDSTIKRWDKNFDKALEGKYDIYFKKMEIIDKLNLNNEKILLDIENDFVDKTMHSYLMILELNDKGKIKKYTNKFNESNINYKHLKTKEKIYYHLIRNKSRLTKKILKIMNRIKNKKKR